MRRFEDAITAADAFIRAGTLPPRLHEAILRDHPRYATALALAPNLDRGAWEHLMSGPLKPDAALAKALVDRPLDDGRIRQVLLGETRAQVVQQMVAANAVPPEAIRAWYERQSAKKNPAGGAGKAIAKLLCLRTPGAIPADLKRPLALLAGPEAVVHLAARWPAQILPDAVVIDALAQIPDSAGRKPVARLMHERPQAVRAVLARPQIPLAVAQAVVGTHWLTDDLLPRVLRLDVDGERFTAPIPGWMAVSAAWNRALTTQAARTISAAAAADAASPAGMLQFRPDTDLHHHSVHEAVAARAGDPGYHVQVPLSELDEPPLLRKCLGKALRRADEGDSWTDLLELMANPLSPQVEKDMNETWLPGTISELVRWSCGFTRWGYAAGRLSRAVALGTVSADDAEAAHRRLEADEPRPPNSGARPWAPFSTLTWELADPERAQAFTARVERLATELAAALPGQPADAEDQLWRAILLLAPTFEGGLAELPDVAAAMIR
ncbi:hypothetical protein D5H75_31310 [Bailinhaonella thermotolerans]|uniref:Uncharacterized protein n=1 Tax=Bailinhaonella thermotolerans TaxID=1070861 RepID=A0A3A4ARL4_9ACTN|nr:hypothetical protein D5H75_31310 [Bailinhaonella thermotolerans]